MEYWCRKVKNILGTDVFEHLDLKCSFDFLPSQLCVSGAILCIIYTEPTIASPDQSVVKIHANTNKYNWKANTNKAILIQYKCSIQYNTWMNVNIDYPQCVKTDIKQRFKVVRKERDVCGGPRPYPLPLRPHHMSVFHFLSFAQCWCCWWLAAIILFVKDD